MPDRNHRFACAAAFGVAVLIVGGCRERAPGPVVRPRPDVVPPVVAIEVAPESLRERWSDATDVPWRSAYSLARICEAAYDHDAASLEATLRAWNFDRVDQVTGGSMFGYVASTDSVVVVAFRGTDGFERADWVVNLSLGRQKVRHGNVHGGFYRSMLSMYDKVLLLARSHGAGEKQVWVTGHSLGGALAVAFTYEVLANGALEPFGVVTFGQPLVGDAGVRDFLNSRLEEDYVRFVNGRDPVTRVPPTFKHCGAVIRFADGEFTVTPAVTYAAASDAPGDEVPADNQEPEAMSVEEFQQFQRDLAAESANAPPTTADGEQAYGGNLPLISDHYMESYISEIARSSRK